MKMHIRKRRFLARFNLDPELCGLSLFGPFDTLYPKPYNSKRVRIGKKYQ